MKRYYYAMRSTVRAMRSDRWMFGNPAGRYGWVKEFDKTMLAKVMKTLAD